MTFVPSSSSAPSSPDAASPASPCESSLPSRVSHLTSQFQLLHPLLPGLLQWPDPHPSSHLCPLFSLQQQGCLHSSAQNLLEQKPAMIWPCLLPFHPISQDPRSSQNIPGLLPTQVSFSPIGRSPLPALLLAACVVQALILPSGPSPQPPARSVITKPHPDIPAFSSCPLMLLPLDRLCLYVPRCYVTSSARLEVLRKQGLFWSICSCVLERCPERSRHSGLRRTYTVKPLLQVMHPRSGGLEVYPGGAL